MSQMSCYGKSFGKLPSCQECEYTNYCKDARDIKPLDAATLDNEPEATPTQTPIADKSLVLLEIIEAAIQHKSDWRVVEAKIRHPDWSLSKIAKTLGYQSKQAAAYRMQLFVQLVPEVFDALLFNRNYNKGRISERYTKRIPSWDKRSRKIEAQKSHPTLPGL